jgi:hypothetical protein
MGHLLVVPPSEPAALPPRYNWEGVNLLHVAMILCVSHSVQVFSLKEEMGFSPAEMKEMLLTYSRLFQHKQREGKLSSLYILKGMPPETARN